MLNHEGCDVQLLLKLLKVFLEAVVPDYVEMYCVTMRDVSDVRSTVIK